VSITSSFVHDGQGSAAFTTGQSPDGFEKTAGNRPVAGVRSFSKNIYPRLAEMKTVGFGRRDMIFSQHPFVVYNALRHSTAFSAARLMSLLNDLLEMEIAFKSSGSDPHLLLERFLIRACS